MAYGYTKCDLCGEEAWCCDRVYNLPEFEPGTMKFLFNRWYDGLICEACSHCPGCGQEVLPLKENFDEATMSDGITCRCDNDVSEETYGESNDR